MKAPESHENTAQILGEVHMVFCVIQLHTSAKC